MCPKNKTYMDTPHAVSSMLTSKMETIRQVVSDTKSKQSGIQSTLSEVNATNELLIDSYEASLSIIADMSALLYQYMSFFDETEQMLEELRISSTQSAAIENAKNTNKLVSKNIKTSSLKCFEQLTQLTPLFKQNDISTHKIETFSKVLETVYNQTKPESKSTQKPKRSKD